MIRRNTRLVFIIILCAVLLAAPACAGENGAEETDAVRSTEVGGFCGMSMMSSCGSDEDCATGGCSGEVCGAKSEIVGIVTPCDFRECYDRIAYGVHCGCVEGACQWYREGAPVD